MVRISVCVNVCMCVHIHVWVCVYVCLFSAIFSVCQQTPFVQNCVSLGVQRVREREREREKQCIAIGVCLACNTGRIASDGRMWSSHINHHDVSGPLYCMVMSDTSILHWTGGWISYSSPLHSGSPAQCVHAHQTHTHTSTASIPLLPLSCTK